MAKSKNTAAVVYALLAACFYAIHTPLSKILLHDVPAALMASFLYTGAGLGVGIMYAFHSGRRAESRGLPVRICPIPSA